MEIHGERKMRAMGQSNRIDYLVLGERPQLNPDRVTATRLGVLEGIAQLEKIEQGIVEQRKRENLLKHGAITDLVDPRIQVVEPTTGNAAMGQPSVMI